jgi:predicted phosphodiesterase
MKYVVIGDIHGRTIWKSIMIKEWDADKYIFLGDYVSTHDPNMTSSMQIANLEDILIFKDSVKSMFVLLRGNHDDQMLGYHWAQCSGYDKEVSEYMSLIKDRFLKLTQWVYQIPDTNIVCSHAGIAEHFYQEVLKYLKTNPEDFKIEDINKIEPCELFGFTCDDIYDMYGQSSWQPCTWIRPQTLIRYGLKDYIQIVGHTPVTNISNSLEFYKKEDDVCNVWMCDCLENNQYLVVIDGKIEVRKI